jgi:3',5'-cyclic AMP phosphodiesterase CpdA
MLTILHGSDLHFGKHFDPDAVSIFRNVVDTLSPELMVLSGDFTQRAKLREYRAARDFLADLPDIPVVVTPGNHDVPLYRFWERVLAPHGKYRRFISAELDSVTRLEGATVVSLNSTSPYRAIVNGRLRNAQMLFASRAFQAAPGTDLKILVAHHNLAPDPHDGSDQVLPGHGDSLAAFSEIGVDLILGGHLHRSFSIDSGDVVAGGRSGPGGVQRMVLAYCGTTTSLRGRTRETGKNSFNLLRVDQERIEVTSFVRVRGVEEFSVADISSFPREGTTP